MLKNLLLSLALIISANTWADKISFSCENIKKNPFEKDLLLDFVIDTKKNTASIDGKAYDYKEEGDNVSFRIPYPISGRMVLNRMTGTLLAQTFSDYLMWETKNTFKCKKAERLF